jgi:hypothetical protein
VGAILISIAYIGHSSGDRPSDDNSTINEIPHNNGEQSSQSTEDITAIAYNDPLTEPFKNCLIKRANPYMYVVGDKNAAADLMSKECPRESEAWHSRCESLGGDSDYCNQMAETMTITAMGVASVIEKQDPVTAFKDCVIARADPTRDDVSNPSASRTLISRGCPQESSAFLTKCESMGQSQIYCQQVEESTATTAIEAATITQGQAR